MTAKICKKGQMRMKGKCVDLSDDDYVIFSNDKLKGWSSKLNIAKERAKKMAIQSGSGHAVYRYITTLEGGTGREIK